MAHKHKIPPTSGVPAAPRRREDTDRGRPGETDPILSLLDDDVKTGLRKRAVDNGRSMEAEVRLILRDAVGPHGVPDKGLGTAIHKLFKAVDGVALQTPPSFD